MDSLFGDRDVLVIDGGLATRLEHHGCDLSDELWSARLLRDDPGLIRRVHREFFEAGADIAVTASYQASTAAFERRGVPRAEAEGLLRLSVRLAELAPDEAGGGLGAASLGPFAAALADGSVFTGDHWPVRG